MYQAVQNMFVSLHLYLTVGNNHFDYQTGIRFDRNSRSEGKISKKTKLTFLYHLRCSHDFNYLSETKAEKQNGWFEILYPKKFEFLLT